MKNERTMMKVYSTGTCVCISTYSRKFGRSSRFLVIGETLHNWLDNDDGKTFVDEDCGNYLHIAKRGNRLLVMLTWISESSSGRLTGYREMFCVDADTFDAATYCERPVGLLSLPDDNGKIEFSTGAQKLVGRMNKQERRAFSKAMRRDAMRWPSTTTYVYHDFNKDFYFTTNDGLCGGLVLHNSNSAHSGIYYGVHT